MQMSYIKENIILKSQYICLFDKKNGKLVESLKFFFLQNRLLQNHSTFLAWQL
jgi:hypothetical protein